MTTKYRRNGREAGAAEALDEDGILRDGFSVMVPMTMRDALPQHARVTDANGGTAGLHRPGYRIADANDDARQRAYDEYRRRICDAWKSPGREIEVKPLTGDAREDARAAYLEDMTNAWRGPCDSGKW
jgi:hypothetical protein